MKRFISVIIAIGITSVAFSQIHVKGIVLDKASNEPLIGVTISHLSSQTGTTTLLDGTFSIAIPANNRRLTFSYIGYSTRTIEVPNQEGTDLGTVFLESEAIGLNDVTVTSSVAIRRKTPVALSVIEANEIEQKLGTQEFPEILKTTPSVYATRDGGGYGDSRINLRGFESTNIAVMINGVPVNDMEWGGVYWSNWTGLGDVTRSMQVQRGLGASKVAVPSIGGSINIVTRSTDAKKGGAFSYTTGNDGYNKLSFSVSSGLTNGWALSLLGTKTSGDGYILGTEFEAYTWFGSISKIINENHQLSLIAIGNSQWHNQRSSYDKLLITEWEKLSDKYKFNPTYGFATDGRRVIPDRNHYHKPQISLNHFWTVNEKSSLSTVLYLSLGNGGKTIWRGRKTSDLYGADSKTGLINTVYRDTLTGYMDFGTLQKKNYNSPDGSIAILADSRNSHIWTGLLSTYNTKISKQIDFYGGLDLRYYQGLHDAVIVDLLGGKYFIDTARKNVKDILKNTGNDFLNEKLKVGDVVYRDNTGYLIQEGAFAQTEYNKNNVSLFIAGSISNSTYWKVDRFYYSKDNSCSQLKSFLGFNAKGGSNYNINKYHNVFFNIGYLSRAPFMSGGYFTNIHTSNNVNKNAVNEKSFSTELGYGFRSNYFTTNLNLYYTKWIDKTMTRSYGSNQNAFVNLRGVNARHQGIELDFITYPINRLTIKGSISIGDWIWDSNAIGYIYDTDGQPTNGKGIVKDLSDEHKVEVDLKGVKVGNSAQSTFSLGGKYSLFNDAFSISVDYIYYARNYANFNIKLPDAGETCKYYTPWQIPDAGIMDLFVNYRFKLNGLNASLAGNVHNLLNQRYIADALDLNPTEKDKSADYEKEKVTVMYGFLRTYSISLKIKF